MAELTDPPTPVSAQEGLPLLASPVVVSPLSPNEMMPFALNRDDSPVTPLSGTLLVPSRSRHRRSASAKAGRERAAASDNINIEPSLQRSNSTPDPLKRRKAPRHASEKPSYPYSYPLSKPLSIHDAPRTDSLECYKRAKWWIEDCRHNHPVCARTRGIKSGESDERELPTRVIDVGHEDGSQPPRLIEKNGERGHYITLSYCWGNIPGRHKTTQANMEEYKQALPYSQLPQTFKDAIIVTRKLGFRYLWIDCFCIIQDDEQDWRHEASQMEKTYRSAVVAISALAGADSNAGIFHDRKPIKYIEEWASSSTIISYNQRPRQIFHEEIRTGELSKRGWTLQERILSPALLHYGERQLFWECGSMIGSDTDPCIAICDSPYFKALHDDLNIHLDLPEGHFLVWCDLVRIYTDRKLTVPTDRSLAIAGLANGFARQYQAKYLVGLWREDLDRGLLWVRDELKAANVRTRRNQESNKQLSGPSWSWISYDMPVAYGWWFRDPVRRLPNWSDANIVSVDDESLVVSGVAGAANYAISSKFRFGEGTVTLWGRNRPLACIMDFDEPRTGECLCLKITTWAEKSDFQRTYFLILAAIIEGEGTSNERVSRFRRIGIGADLPSEVEWAFKHSAKHQVTIV